MHPTDRSLDRARRAFAALRASASFAEALDAWEDFLVYWGRTINKAAEMPGPHWDSIKPAVWRDPNLAYAKQARNADEHGLAAPAGKRGGSTLSFGIELGDGLVLDPASGRVGISLGSGTTMIVFPEELELLPVTGRDRVVHRPPSHLGKPMKAVELGAYALAWLERVISEARQQDERSE